MFNRMKKVILFCIWTLLSFMLVVGFDYLSSFNNTVLNVSLYILWIFYILLSVKTKCFTVLFNKKDI